MLGDPLVLILLPDHEAGDVLQKHQRNLAPAAKLDEVRTLQSTLGKEDAVVRQHPDRIAHHPREAADERRPVRRFELVETAAVDHPGDDLPHVERSPQVRGHDAVDLLRRVQRRLGPRQLPRQILLRQGQVGDGAAHDRQRLGVVGREVVSHAGDHRVHVRATQLLRRHLLARRRLHQRRPGEEDRPRSFDDHRLIAHRRHVGAAGCARAHHGGDLRNALRRHPRLVIEDAAKVLPVREDVCLLRQERPARVHQVDARQTVLLGDLLRAQVLLYGDRVICAALHGRVVGDDHHFVPGHPPHAGHDTGRRSVAAIHLPGGQRAHLQERRPGVKQAVDPLPCRQLAALTVPVDQRLAAALADAVERPLQRLHPLTHDAAVLRELGFGRLNRRAQDRYDLPLEEG